MEIVKIYSDYYKYKVTMKCFHAVYINICHIVCDLIKYLMRFTKCGEDYSNILTKKWAWYS